MKQLNGSFNSKIRSGDSAMQRQLCSRRVSLRDSLSFVNHQTIPVRITKGRLTANLRFSRSEEEGDIVIAQVLDSDFKIVDLKCD